jgi:hypothetical protein
MKRTSEVPKKPPTQRIGFGLGTHPGMQPEYWAERYKTVRIVQDGWVFVLPPIR